MTNIQYIADLKTRILSIENKLNGLYRDDFDQLYDLIEKLEDNNNTSNRPGNLDSDYAELEKKQIVEKLRASEDKLRIVVNNANVLIFIIDKNGIITLSEGKLLNLFKFLPNQIIGISIFDIYEDKPEVKAAIEKALQGTTTSSMLEIQDFIFETVFSPYKNLSGDIAGVVAIAVNVTERLKMAIEREKLIEDLKLSNLKIMQDANKMIKFNDRLIDSEEKLKRMNDEKDKFISIISHDIRSPFSGILGIVDGIVAYYDRYGKKELKSAMEMLSKTSHYLFDMLENLLVWARASRGKMDINKENIPLFTIVKANVELLINNAILKRLSIKNNTNKNLFVVADENMLSTVLRNLISNAIKFTNVGGEIIISAHKSEQNDQLEIWVSDNGVGMPPKVVNSIFQLNRQFTSSGTNNEKGTGLGLFICKEMIQLNGGKIWVESTPSEGTCFKFTLDYVEDYNYIEQESDFDIQSDSDVAQLSEELFEISTDDLIKMKIENMALLIDELENEFIPECAEISEMQIMSYIEEFTDRLKSAAIDNNCINLQEYAELLYEKVKIMDVVQMNKYLDYFPTLVSKLKNAFNKLASVL